MSSVPEGPQCTISTPPAPMGQPEMQSAPCWPCTMPSDLAHPLVPKKLPQSIWQENHQVNAHPFDFFPYPL
ncbi:hypothetical protein V6N13_082091 [Hibiscus sabdariffa]